MGPSAPSAAGETAPISDPASAVARIEEITPELRGCAIFAEGGRVLASSGEEAEWANAGGELLAAIASAAPEPPAHVHIATGDGEVFSVRHGGLTMVAVAERFVLSSLLLFDLRAVLRELEA
jgi:hypothetical protein